MKKLFTVILASSSLFLFSCGNKPSWLSDFDDAMEIAAKSRRNVFVTFTSESDEISSKLDENAFRSEKFLGKYSKKFVFVNLDFSKRLDAENLAADASAEQKAAADKIIEETGAAMDVAERYAVRSLPTTLVLSGEGYVITALNFFDIREDFDPNMNPESTRIEDVVDIYDEEQINKTMDEAVAKSDEFDALLKIAEKGSDDAKIDAINEIFDNTDFPYRALLKPLSERVVALDPKNKSGAVPKHVMSIANADAIAAGQDSEKVCAVFVAAAENPVLDINDRQLMYYQAAMSLMSLGGDSGRTKELLKKSLDAAPQSESASLISSVIEHLDSALAAELDSDQ